MPALRQRPVRHRLLFDVVENDAPLHSLTNASQAFSELHGVRRSILSDARNGAPLGTVVRQESALQGEHQVQTKQTGRCEFTTSAVLLDTTRIVLWVTRELLNELLTTRITACVIRAFGVPSLTTRAVLWVTRVVVI